MLTGITDESNVRFSTYTYNDQGIMQSEEHAGGVNRYEFIVQSPNGEQSTTQVTDPLSKYRGYVFTRSKGVMRTQGTSVYCPTCPNLGQATYDGNGNVESRSDLNGSRTEYVFDQTRNLETSRTEGLTSYGSVTSATRTITTQWHPIYRLPVEEKVYAGAGANGTPERVTAYTHDAAGNVLTRTVSDVSVVPTVSRSWTYTWDSYGRMLTENGPRTDVSDLTTYTYYTCTTGTQCGQINTVKNAKNQITTYNTYNAHGQVIQVTDSNGVKTRFAYDARQRLTTRTLAYATAAAEVTTFEYWPTGLLKKVTAPDGSFLLYTYDPAHRLTQIEDGLGNQTRFVLDAMGNRQVENQYDPFGALARTRTQLFNDLGQLWQQLQAAGTDTTATVFGYDQAGNQTTTAAPLGRNTVQSFDALNRLKEITDPAYGVTRFEYDSRDNLTQVTDPRNLVTGYQYNALGDLKQLTSPTRA
ncbi:MAG: hypothetical protein R3F58_05295 [Steroidobacteraceae bacterium]